MIFNSKLSRVCRPDHHIIHRLPKTEVKEEPDIKEIGFHLVVLGVLLLEFLELIIRLKLINLVFPPHVLVIVVGPPRAIAN